MASEAPVEGGRAESEIIEQALAGADPNVLRIALYQATGNPLLAALQVQRVAVRDGAGVELALSGPDAQLVRLLAADFLRQRSEWSPPELPSREEQRELVRLFAGRELDPDELSMSLEELAFEGFSRAVDWSSERPAEADSFHVLIVGAGISGLTVGIQLARLGIPFTIVERQAGIGGTWHRNRYPDIRVDTPCTGYQFKFVKDFRWSEYFPGRCEVAEYLSKIARDHGVAQRIRFGRELVSAEWGAAEGMWTALVRDTNEVPEQVTANVIITACGLFNAARFPDVPGLSDFAGQIIHPTLWEDGTDVGGKRVAVIGNGSTGVQIMPRLAEIALNVTVYQRTPSWIRPRPLYGKKIPKAANWLLDNMPYYWNWEVCGTFLGGDSKLNSEALKYDPEWQAKGGIISKQNDALRDWLTSYINRKLAARPELIPAVLPTYAPLGRRMVVDNGWYDALLSDNVELVPYGIDRFTERGIISQDGVEREFDVVVSATGYSVKQYLWPASFTGRDGVRLTESWAEQGPRAYLGITVPGFPNLFIMYGPNGQPRAGNFHSWAEIISRYISQGIVSLIETRMKSLEVRPEVFRSYNKQLDEAFKDIIWRTESANGYFAVEEGKGAVSMPWEHYEYYSMVRELDFDDFAVT